MIEVEGLVKQFSDGRKLIRAVDDVSFVVPSGKFYTLLGPSGCGKTTTLRSIAGLERPNAGEIRIDRETVYSSSRRLNLPPDKRSIGMVFQSYAIWPHMTVFENAAFPLRVGSARISNEEVRERVLAALELVQLGGTEGRMATQLSGGQQQRLAVARAIVARPSVLLLDEPLSNLDAKLRERMRVELRELQKRLGITALYVTHDQIEALSMSDVVAVMQDGKIVQEGPPLEIYYQPRTEFVAQFIGTVNLIPGRLLPEQDGQGLALVDTALGLLRCTRPDGPLPTEWRDGMLLIVRPERIQLHRSSAVESDNSRRGVVTQTVFCGEYVDCRVAVADLTLRVRQQSPPTVAVGDEVWVELPADGLTPLGGRPPAGTAAPEVESIRARSELPT
jgi:iron(III) transport system ATP-binding protein